MKSYSFLLMLGALILWGCSDENDDENGLSKEMPATPGAVEIDINQDSNPDFEIKYSVFTWDGVGASGDGISGYIKALNENAVLRKNDDYNLFLQPGDTIWAETSRQFSWEENSRTTLISISTSSANDYYWPATWEIASKLNVDNYYLGFKLKNSGKTGWLKFDLDKKGGGIKLVNQSFTTEPYIVIVE